MNEGQVRPPGDSARAFAAPYPGAARRLERFTCAVRESLCRVAAGPAGMEALHQWLTEGYVDYAELFE